jgi:2-polyprenyl-3-methyl-5-hydroxy-6-metoxy-1,4-benzoquinol methylase
MSPEYGAEYYAGRNMDRDQDVHVPRTLRKIARVVDLAPGSRLLEVGCGMGGMTRAFAGLVGRVTAIDISGHAIEAARRASPPPNVEFAAADALEWTSDGAFDVVISLSVFEHFDAGQRRLFLSRARSWLAPGGTLVLHVPITRSWAADRRKRRLRNPGIDYTGDPTHRTRFSVRSFRRSLRHGGFRIECEWIRYSRGRGPEFLRRAFLGLLPPPLRHKFAMEAMVSAVPADPHPRST